jgi:hypothetical protein
VAICRVKFAGETRDTVAHLYPTAEEARLTTAIVHAAALCGPELKYLGEGKGAVVTARFGADGITIVDPNRAGKGRTRCFRKFTEGDLRAR